MNEVHVLHTLHSLSSPALLTSFIMTSFDGSHPCSVICYLVNYDMLVESSTLLFLLV
jgi:hypothetical protein